MKAFLETPTCVDHRDKMFFAVPNAFCYCTFSLLRVDPFESETYFLRRGRLVVDADSFRFAVARRVGLLSFKGFTRGEL